MTAQDITPGLTGLMNLWSQGDSLYEVRNHLCGLEAYRLIAMANYTDIFVWISPGTCIRLFNPNLEPVYVEHAWTMDPTNSLLIFSTILWILLLCAIGGCILTACIFGGAIVRLLRGKKRPVTAIDPGSQPSAPYLSQIENVPSQHT